jgi:hypothetical protein
MLSSLSLRIFYSSIGFLSAFPYALRAFIIAMDNHNYNLSVFTGISQAPLINWHSTQLPGLANAYVLSRWAFNT